MCSYDYDYPKIYRESRPVAKKKYSCFECRREIPVGEKYQYIFAVDYGDSSPWISRTCINCLIPQSWLLKECGGFMHENLYEEILEHAQEYRKMFLYRWAINIKNKWAHYDKFKKENY